MHFKRTSGLPSISSGAHTADSCPLNIRVPKTSVHSRKKATVAFAYAIIEGKLTVRPQPAPPLGSRTLLQHMHGLQNWFAILNSSLKDMQVALMLDELSHILSSDDQSWRQPAQICMRNSEARVAMVAPVT